MLNDKTLEWQRVCSCIINLSPPTTTHTHTLFKTKCTASPITIGFRQEPTNKNAIQNRTETLLMDQQGLTAGPIEVRGIKIKDGREDWAYHYLAVLGPEVQGNEEEGGEL